MKQETAIHKDNRLIGVITRPVKGVFWAHSSVSYNKRKFRVKWQAANWIHALYDNHMDCPTQS